MAFQVRVGPPGFELTRHHSVGTEAVQVTVRRECITPLTMNSAYIEPSPASVFIRIKRLVVQCLPKLSEETRRRDQETGGETRRQRRVTPSLGEISPEREREYESATDQEE